MIHLRHRFSFLITLCDQKSPPLQCRTVQGKIWKRDRRSNRLDDYCPRCVLVETMYQITNSL